MNIRYWFAGFRRMRNISLKDSQHCRNMATAFPNSPASTLSLTIARVLETDANRFHERLR